MEYATLREKIAAEKQERLARYESFAAAVAKAAQAAEDAAKATVPTPMIVQQHASPLDDRSPVIKEWRVDGGPCGYATIYVRPATCSFARWAVKSGLGRVSRYHGGVALSVYPQFSKSSPLCQSYEVNTAYANAYAKALEDALGLSLYVHSYLD